MLIPRSVVQLARGRVLSISRLPQHLERDAKKSQPSAPRSNRTNKKGRTLATLISKSSWVTCCRRSRSAYMPRERKEITWSASLAIKAPRACVLRHRFASPRSRRRVRWKASQGPLPPLQSSTVLVCSLSPPAHPISFHARHPRRPSHIRHDEYRKGERGKKVLTRFGTDTPDFGTTAVAHLLGEGAKVDSSLQGHLSEKKTGQIK